MRLFRFCTGVGAWGLLLAAGTGCGPEVSVGEGSDSSGGTGTGPDPSTTGETDPDTDGAGDSETSSSGGPETGSTEGDATTGDEPPPAEPWGGPCEAVEIVVAIDAAGNAEHHREDYLGRMQGMLEAISTGVPAGTEIRVGIVGAEMDRSPVADAQADEGVCRAWGEGGLDSSEFYVTPEDRDTGHSGAQGRLLEHAGITFVSLRGGEPEDVGAASQWLVEAGRSLDRTSELHMLAGPLGWLAHPANASANAGFLSEGPSVLGMFAFTNIFDVTPPLTDRELLANLREGKAACGGDRCLVLGGQWSRVCNYDTPIEEIWAALPFRSVVIEPSPVVGNVRGDLERDAAVRDFARAVTRRCLNFCEDFEAEGCTLRACGDGHIGGSEVCDGDDLGGAVCPSGLGTLRCAEDCSGFIEDACEPARCGDGLRNGAESCDGRDGLPTCAELGVGHGWPQCTDDCKLDTTSCM